METRFILLTLIVLTGCSKPKADEDQVKDLDQPDSVETQVLLGNQKDTLSYIGYIGKFEDNNTFYTDLYFVDNFNYDLYNEIAGMGEQVIFNEDEIRRTRMEIGKVGQYFNLTGLENVAIYNSKNQKLTTGKLSHIEYIENMIENSFVAVFQVENTNISDYLFCVGNSANDLAKIDFLSFEDEKLKAELINFLEISTDHLWSVEHYKLDNQVIYSTVSCDTTAYIIETMDKDHITLYKSKSNEAINGLAAISRKINGRPILLTECGMPETDMMWTSVLIFNGTGYETSINHRISKYRR